MLLDLVRAYACGYSLFPRYAVFLCVFLGTRCYVDLERLSVLACVDVCLLGVPIFFLELFNMFD